MCLAIPAQIVHIDEDGLATVDILGVSRSISIDLTPQAHVDDFVLVHAGFSIEVVDADFAQETIDLIMEFPELAGENLTMVEQSDEQAADGVPAEQMGSADGAEHTADADGAEQAGRADGADGVEQAEHTGGAR